MAERTRGIYRLVTIPAIYQRIQLALAGGDPYARVGALVFDQLDGKNVLEIGCGPGHWSKVLRHTKHYTGIDWNPRHIEQARAQYGSQQARFICGDLGDPSLLNSDAPLDAVIGIGILHHLDDTTARNVLARAAELLVPGGRFIGIEPVIHKGQNPIARLLKALDSGRHIRGSAGYEQLFPPAYVNITTHVRQDLMRVPYSHCLINANIAASAKAADTSINA
jgi:SAM-dependent methyltransferase